MERISKTQLAILNAHLEAKKADKFDSDTEVYKTTKEVTDALRAGKTIRSFLQEIELRFAPITANILSSMSHGEYQSKSYQAGVRKGFRKILTYLGIV